MVNNSGSTESVYIFVHSLPINVEFLAQAKASSFHKVCSNRLFVCCVLLAIVKLPKSCHHAYVEIATRSLLLSVYAKIKAKFSNKASLLTTGMDLDCIRCVGVVEVVWFFTALG